MGNVGKLKMEKWPICQIKAAFLDFLLKDVYFVMYCRYDVTSKVIEKCENQIFDPKNMSAD